MFNTTVTTTEDRAWNDTELKVEALKCSIEHLKTHCSPSPKTVVEGAEAFYDFLTKKAENPEK